MNTKTPAMVLQELTVKRGLPPPTYTLMNERTKQGTHQNEFYYQVVAAYSRAIGNGSSKQIAKHDAAKKLLAILEQDGIYKPAENPMQDSIPGLSSTVKNAPVKTPVNCISTLSDMCDENKIPMPRFVEISDVGPPHCRQFTYECSVGSVKTRATATTKKQAKQIAAKEILDRITDILPQLKAEHNREAKEIAEKEAEVIEKYNELSTCLNKANFSTKIEDYNLVLKKIMEEKRIALQEIELYIDPATQENFEIILKKLELSYQIDVIQENCPTIVCLSLSAETPFTVLGVGQNMKAANVAAVTQAFEFIKILIQ